MWALGLANKRIAIPNNVCYSVPLAVYLSGNEPVWVDIDKKNMRMNLKDLWLECHAGECDAVIAVHSYGIPCDIINIAAFCAKENIPLIEDCAVALGAGDVGHYGDVSILSFGEGKIINNGGDGAILTDDYDLAKSVGVLQYALPMSDRSLHQNTQRLSNVHTHLYNSYYWDDWCKIFVFGAAALRCPYDFLSVQDHFGLDYLSLEKKLDNLDRNVESRWNKWKELDGLLGGYTTQISDNIGVDWRYNFLVEPEHQQLLLKRLHKKGFKASSWHPPSDIFWQERSRDDSTPTPNADWVGDRIINLWVDDSVDDEYIIGVSDEVRRFLDEQV